MHRKTPPCEAPAMKRCRAVYSEEIAASAEAVFDLVHDYDRRLSWDTLLRDARVEDGRAPGVGAVAACTGRWFVGGMCFRTRYVSFCRGAVAAVKLVGGVSLSRRFTPSKGWPTLCQTTIYGTDWHRARNGRFICDRLSGHPKETALGAASD